MDELTKQYFANLNQQERQALADYNQVIELDNLLDAHFEMYTQKVLRNWLANNPDKKSWLVERIKTFKFKKVEDLRISQSLIKSFWDYSEGNICGELYKESLFNKKISPYKTSDAMLAGQVFEYIATGQKNYNCEVPELPSMFSKDGYSKQGEVIKAQADNWKKFVRTNKFLRVKTGEFLSYETQTYKATALPDVVAQKGKQTYIIDLKFGDPDATFGDFAWADQTLKYKDKLLLQAKQNVLLWYKMTGEKAQFMFYIASKTNPNNAKARIIAFKDIDGMLKEHELLIENTYKGLVFLLENGIMEPTPELKFCTDCKVSCVQKVSVANIKTITI